MIDYLANIFNILAEKQYILLILGYLGCDRVRFSRISIISIFSVILASYLKSVFQQPLPPGSHPGWAMPSTHMMFSITLWFSMAWEFRNKIIALIGILVCALFSWAMLYKNYHYPLDLFASLIFSSILLVLYYLLLKKWPRSKDHEVYMLIGIIGCILTYINATPEEWKFHIWGMCAAIFGISLGYAITHLNKINNNNNKLFKISRSLIGISGFYFFLYIFNNLDINQSDDTTAFFKYLLLALWVSLFSEQLSKPLNKIFMNEKKQTK